MSSSPFAALPIELVLSVISFAAADGPTALALAVVSSWVRSHAEPALFHTARLRSARALASFLAALDRRPRAFAHRSVRRLSITALGPISAIHAVLSRCTGIASLACAFSVPSYVHRLPAQSPQKEPPRSLPVAPTEQHLLSLACRDGLDLAIISPTVSRLRMQLTPAVTPQNIAQLAALPRLTHLALLYNQQYPGGLDAIKHMLRPVIDAGILRLLVLQVAGSAPDAHVQDIRRWNLTIRKERSSGNPLDGDKPSDLTVSACKAPLCFLSEWEESDQFWHAHDRTVSDM